MIDWVLVLTIMTGHLEGTSVQIDTVSIHTERFSNETACTVTGTVWKKSVEEELTKMNVNGKVIVLAGCIPSTIPVQLPKDDPNVI